MEPNCPVEYSGYRPPKRHGVTVVTMHGRALTYGIPPQRTRRMLQQLAAGQYDAIAQGMAVQKVLRLIARGN